MIQSISSIVTGIIIAFIYSWELSLFIIGLSPLFAIGGYLEMKIMVGLAGSEALEGAGQVSLLLRLAVFSYTAADHLVGFMHCFIPICCLPTVMVLEFSAIQLLFV